MKLLLDQGLPRSAAELLRRDGVDAVHVGEIGMAMAEDPAILVRGSQEDRVIVTLDADFHALLVLSQASKPSVIRLRIEGLKAEGLVQLLGKVLDECTRDIEKYALVTVQDHRIRIRSLPLVEKSIE
ncbi:MAG: hypothetical protein GKR89_01925 [Candidatus Latescibacteria bacterium]|nr:hypothetical protein [Candidatus Latescibacterota bacterium]